MNSGHQQLIELTIGHQQGPFNIHIEEFRESGLQHKLLFITDVKTLLRSEERKAWQNLVRVISHEINNSLSPISSISQTLMKVIQRKGLELESDKDLYEGLKIISERAHGLSLFIDSYKQLAKLPAPQKKRTSIHQLLKKVCLLYSQQSIIIESTNDISLTIDPIQFEQVLINLLKNAIESMSLSNPDGSIHIHWKELDFLCRITISDQGEGISNPGNLFIPFYSTKSNGSGIGLVLCRQIIEAHNGHLSIVNRKDRPGCNAILEVPLNLTQDSTKKSVAS